MKRSALAIALLLASCAPVSAPPDRAAGVGTTDLPAMKSFATAPASRPIRSNAEIAQDFLDLSFEMESGRKIPIFNRFEGPVTVRVIGNAPASLVPDLDRLLRRLRSEAGIDISRVNSGDASITIEAVPRGRLQRAVPNAACFVVPRVSSWENFRAVRRTPAVDWTTLTERTRAAVFLPSDTAPQDVRDCLHEELAQALGPLNDLYRLPDSVFNDDNIHAVLTGFDMLILRATYAPELRSGMSREQVAARLPALLNRLNPRGANGGRSYQTVTTDRWTNAIETALKNGSSFDARRRSAARAVDIARSYGWTGPRRGFSLYVLGRLQLITQPGRAILSFRESFDVYNGSSLTKLHAAHVAVQLAAYALSSGDGAATLAITGEAIPAARDAENAALLATLLMFRAEALDLTGQAEEARAVRLDSLAWARYGFGDAREVRARLQEVRDLNPAREIRTAL
ncbi:DUF2927 domain-containing protein [Aestuariibius sp. 2305UL40-4]|uniref:DUF2927 domain-containing protein n=1 Tax=Aestuariibius violaceus TaxID=3234132 RepID=UPI00345E62BD